jgi:hypothetical protein
VAASAISGNPEVVRGPAAGLIVAQNSAHGSAAAVRVLQAAPPGRAATRAYAERFGWKETSRGQLELFQRITGKAR